MGYEMHITRAEFWAENERHRISQAEWLRVVKQDAELSIDKQNGPLFAVWGPTSSRHSRWLDWSEGNIHTKNPDGKTLAKMLYIAELLEATVQGDDGEIYASPDDFPESVDIAGTEPQVTTRHDSELPLPLRRKLLWNRVQYIVVALVVLAYVLYDLARG